MYTVQLVICHTLGNLRLLFLIRAILELGALAQWQTNQCVMNPH